jgi:hypothetical protein
VVVVEEGEAGEAERLGWMSIDWPNAVEIDSVIKFMLSVFCVSVCHGSNNVFKNSK